MLWAGITRSTRHPLILSIIHIMSSTTRRGQPPINGAGLAGNARAASAVRIIWVAIIGLWVGAIGHTLTGLSGFIGLVLAQAISGGLIWARAGGDIQAYFNKSFFSFMLGGVFEFLVTYVLAWTFGYAVCNLYQTAA